MMVNLRNVNGNSEGYNLGSLSQAGNANAVKRKKAREELKNISLKETKKRVKQFLGRDIEDPEEEEHLENLAEEIRNNAEKFV